MIEDLKTSVDLSSQKYFEDSGAKLVTALDLGLDERSSAGQSLFVNVDEEYIACQLSQVKTLEYYGGFEYVDNSVVLGSYKIYQAGEEDCHVRQAIEHYQKNQAQAEYYWILFEERSGEREIRHQILVKDIAGKENWGDAWHDIVTCWEYGIDWIDDDGLWRDGSLVWVDCAKSIDSSDVEVLKRHFHIFDLREILKDGSKKYKELGGAISAG